MTIHAEVLLDVFEEACTRVHEDMNPTTEESINLARESLVKYISMLEQEYYSKQLQLVLPSG